MYPVDRSSTRLALRELITEDVNAVPAVYGSPEATEHLSFEPRGREEVGRIVARSIAAAAETPRGEYALAVVDAILDREGHAATQGRTAETDVRTLAQRCAGARR